MTDVTAAKAALIAVLREAMSCDERTDVNVYYWSDIHAPRIAEISRTTRQPDGGLAGESWMQYDSGNESLLFKCERFVVDTVLGEAQGGLPDLWKRRILAEFDGQ